MSFGKCLLFCRVYCRQIVVSSLISFFDFELYIWMALSVLFTFIPSSSSSKSLHSNSYCSRLKKESLIWPNDFTQLNNRICFNRSLSISFSYRSVMRLRMFDEQLCIQELLIVNIFQSFFREHFTVEIFPWNFFLKLFPETFFTKSIRYF